MHQQHTEFKVRHMCRVLEVSRSGYYEWLSREPSTRDREDERLKIEIRAAHQIMSHG